MASQAQPQQPQQQQQQYAQMPQPQYVLVDVNQLMTLCVGFARMQQMPYMQPCAMQPCAMQPQSSTFGIVDQAMSAMLPFAFLKMGQSFMS